MKRQTLDIIFKNPKVLLSIFLQKSAFLFKNDKFFLQLSYRVKTGKKLNLDHPKTFNEKLQWLKLYDRRPEYTTMVDKYAVKDYVAKKIGDEYVIPTLGVWDRVEDIDFNSLPQQFVLKVTHDSGGLVICKDKSKLDIEKTKRKLNRSWKKDYFIQSREWPYRNVPHRIIAEKYMSDNGTELADFKIHNFNGIPKIILVCRDRYEKTGLKEDFFNERWEHLDLSRPNCQHSDIVEPAPKELNEMLFLAKTLSKDIPFVRTDFYIINHRVYFGEITFFPSSGLKPFEPDHWDSTLGSWIELPSKDVRI
jgi:hypothetical protein